MFLPSPSGDKYGWILPVGALALGTGIAYKLGLIKFNRDATGDVTVKPERLTHDAAFYKNNADLLFNNMNSYVTNASDILRILGLFKTSDDRRQLYKDFGKKASSSNLGALDFNIGQPRDLKQWLLDYHTTKFNNDFVIKYFANAYL